MWSFPSKPVMSYADVAKWTGLTEGALRLRLHAGRMPAPDGRVGQSPFWMAETIAKWAPDGRVRDARHTRSAVA
jgi:hypothetical protein